MQKAKKIAMLVSLNPVQHVSKGISKGMSLLMQAFQIMLTCSVLQQNWNSHTSTYAELISLNNL